jgi:hypothetical protein
MISVIMPCQGRSHQCFCYGDRRDKIEIIIQRMDWVERKSTYSFES